MAEVFISHRTADSGSARKIAVALRRAGHTVWLDTWDITTGDSIIEKMNSALSRCRYVILCVSSSGATSPWLSREWMSTLARQLNGASVTLLPALIDGSEMPVILADIKYANLAVDWEEGLAELLQAIS